jgi:hypothetical protein
LWVHCPDDTTEHVRVCVHVECSGTVGVVDSCSILRGSMVAYVVGKVNKKLSHMTD